MALAQPPWICAACGGGVMQWFIPCPYAWVGCQHYYCCQGCRDNCDDRGTHLDLFGELGHGGLCPGKRLVRLLCNAQRVRARSWNIRATYITAVCLFRDWRRWRIRAKVHHARRREAARLRQREAHFARRRRSRARRRWRGLGALVRLGFFTAGPGALLCELREAPGQMCRESRAH